MMYDYYENVKADVIDFMEANKSYIDFEGCEDMDELYDFVYDMMIDSDSVTGNGSGSYTFSTYEAEENLCHNLDLLGDAMNQFGYGIQCLAEQGAEACDVIIRCYLLSDVLYDEIWRLKDDFEAAHSESEAV